MSENDQLHIPSARELMWPELAAVRALGGSGRVDEIVDAVIRIEQFGNDVVTYRREGSDTRTALEYRLAWGRTLLKNAGALVNSSQGVWATTEFGSSCTEESLALAIAAWQSEYARDHKARRELSVGADRIEEDASEVPNDLEWKDILLERLREMAPDSFERLTQRLLREACFRSVEVLGRSGDGGLDGIGIFQLSLLSFQIYFQCKRYRGVVGSEAVRNFRGAVSGRGEKGLLITTGVFSREAIKEASRDGAPPVDLISGDSLCDLLKFYSLGLSTTVETVERVTVHANFFDQY